MYSISMTTAINLPALKSVADNAPPCQTVAAMEFFHVSLTVTLFSRYHRAASVIRLPPEHSWYQQIARWQTIGILVKPMISSETDSTWRSHSSTFTCSSGSVRQ